MGTSKRKAFSIRDGILKVTLENVWSLRLHEKVIPEFIRNLKASIVEDKVVKDPVLVDEKTLVVLDGMHRAVALRELGYSYIPCCLIDYRLPIVQLGAWYRVVTGGISFSKIMKLVRSSFNDLRLTKVNSASADKMVGEDNCIGALRSHNSACLIKVHEKLDLREAYDLIYLIEEKLRSVNLKISYQTEFDAKTILLNDRSASCLVVPILTKDDVLHFALKGEVFAPKATRHVFPFRLLGLNVPIEFLDGRKFGLEEANEKLQEMLSNQKLVKLPGGQLVNGRRYEEPIYLFESQNTA